MRLSSQGVLDTSFGSGGTATLPTTGDVRNAGMVIDSQDRPIILTSNGETSAYRIGLTRLTTTGQPDTDFDADGVVSSALPATTGNPWPAGMALDSGGGILVVGTVITSVKASGFVARFGTGGAIDGGYGTGGWTAVSDSGTEMAAIHALPGGGAVVAGYDDYAEWVVARLTSGGALDSEFRRRWTRAHQPRQGDARPRLLLRRDGRLAGATGRRRAVHGRRATGRWPSRAGRSLALPTRASAPERRRSARSCCHRSADEGSTRPVRPTAGCW